MRRFTAITLLATICWTGTAVAHPGAGGAPMRGGLGPEPGMMLPMLLHKLGLTDTQHEQVRTILNAHRVTFQTLFAQLRDGQQALDAKLLSTDPIQLTDVMPEIQHVANLRKQIMQEGVAVALEVRGLLTPAQLARAADLQRQVAALRSQMRALLGEPPIDPGTE